MTDFSDIAHNKNRFRAACKNLSVKQMQTMAEHLAEFIEKRAEEEAASLAQDAKKAAEKQALKDSLGYIYYNRYKHVVTTALNLPPPDIMKSR